MEPPRSGVCSPPPAGAVPAAAAAAAPCSPWLLKAPDCSQSASIHNHKLQILHCNDIHAVLDPADASFGTNCGNVARGAPACFGGAARLATALNEARAEGAAVGMDSLVLHAGDQFTGSTQ